MHGDLLPDDGFLTIDGEDFIAGSQPGHVGWRFLNHPVDDRDDAAKAIGDVDYPVHEYGQKEIRCWPRRDDRHALPQWFVSEGKMSLADRYIADCARGVLLAQHFYIATEGNRREDVFDAVLAYPGFNRLAKSDREA